MPENNETLEKARYLKKLGWKQDLSKAPWAWKCPGVPAWYTLADAFDVAKAEEKAKKSLAKEKQ
jgi:hypothetical protein